MRATITNQSYKLMKPEAAEKLAAALQADDEEWTYTAKHDPKGTGWSFVEIADEDGEVIGKV